MQMIMEIDGKKYYLLADYASMVGRGISTIRHLMFIGNRIRKLKYVEAPQGTYYIPVEEYTEFPFTSSGRYTFDKVFHFEKDGSYTQYTPEEIDSLVEKHKEKVNG